jgi:integrase
MARIRLQFVNSFVNKNRKSQRARYYFRRGRKGKAIPLPGIPGDEQFMAAYHAALAASTAMTTLISPSSPSEIGADSTVHGTINALIVNYYKSAAWLDLAQDTRQTRRYLIERFREQHGGKRVALLRRDHFEKMLSEIASPAMKDRWLRAIRGLMNSGIPSMLAENPTAGLKVKRAKSEGHHTWTEAEIAKYRAHWPLGTQARLVLEFALESASRKGEIVRLGPQHLYRGQNGEWRIRIARTKGSRDVDIPMSPELLAAVQAMPRDHLTYIHSRNGKALSKITLGPLFRKWATEAGLPKHCRLHGLKKSGLVEIALAGGTAPELMAVSGHKSMAVAQAYIEAAFKRPELADAALGKVRTKRRKRQS